MLSRLAAGFRAYLVKGPRSTPLLSFAVRHLGCDAGIMITASHNPPADNGMKLYMGDGAQIVTLSEVQQSLEQVYLQIVAEDEGVTQDK